MRLVVVYLVLLGLLAGFAAGWFIGPVIWNRFEPHRLHQPAPVTPPPAGTRWVEVLTTGYCPCSICCEGDADGRTAINRDVQVFPFGIATDKGLIAPRTWLLVPGYGEAMVDDTGGAMRRHAKAGIVHLDLRFRTHAEARRWGQQWHWIAIPDDQEAARRYGLALPTAPALAPPAPDSGPRR